MDEHKKPTTHISKNHTPWTHGYVICDICGTWRPQKQTCDSSEGFTVCSDEEWCKRATAERLP